MASLAPSSPGAQHVEVHSEVSIAELWKLNSNVFRVSWSSISRISPSNYTLVAAERYQPIYRHGGDLTPLYWHHLSYGIRLPLHPFLHKVFRALGIAFAQITPNSTASLVEFVVIYHRVNVRPTLRILSSLVSVKSKGEEGHFYLQAVGDFKLVSNMSTMNKKWRKKFFFVKDAYPILACPT